MATKDWNGFKKNGDTYIPNDATARAGLQNKVDKVTGKGLSTNDYTDADKAKVADAFPRSEQALLGAKNINGTKYVSRTDHSVVWTANSDGSITAVSGTATGDNAQNGLGNPFVAPFTSQVNLTGGVDSHIYLFPYDVTDGGRPYTDSSKTTRTSGNQYGDTPLSFYMEQGHKYSIIARVVQNYSANNNTLYPLLTVASDTDPTYVPHAMTNKELTPAIFEATTNFTFDTDGKSITKQGKIVVPYLRVTGVTATADDTTTPICVVPEECRPSFAKVFPIISSGTITSATLYTDGKIVAKTNLSNATVTISNPWSI